MSARIMFAQAVYPPIPAPLSEDQWQAIVVDTAIWHKWRVFHPRPARTEHGYRTAIIGHKGYVDLTLARDGLMLFAELKSDAPRSKQDPEQIEWQLAMGDHYRLWRPRDWPDVYALLAAPRAGR